uniref:Uncharacterized protein n=1 Tax=Cacopsylla melanoneura TaxID=428564 RepID=A0A8D9FJ30_9HEMI
MLMALTPPLGKLPNKESIIIIKMGFADTLQSNSTDKVCNPLWYLGAAQCQTKYELSSKKIEKTKVGSLASLKNIAFGHRNVPSFKMNYTTYTDPIPANPKPGCSDTSSLKKNRDHQAF